MNGGSALSRVSFVPSISNPSDFRKLTFLCLISQTTQEFLTTALMTTLQGYGLTETWFVRDPSLFDLSNRIADSLLPHSGMAAILVPEFWQYGSVGGPVPSVEIKLQGQSRFSLSPLAQFPSSFR